MTSSPAQFLCERIDWKRPELNGPAALWHAGEADAAARAFIRHLRARPAPHLGYTRRYVAKVRRSADADSKAAATGRWEAALSRDLLMPYHGNALGALGPETVFLAATPDLCRRSAARIIENRERWAEGYWGVVHSLCDLVRCLWPLAECADDDLVPVFSWLLTKADVEWQDARTWNETSLGTSGHNWWAHTLTGFWMLGTFFPELRGMGQFRALAGDYLERELRILFEDDGWSKEGSPGYHTFAADNLIEFAHIATLNGMPANAAVRARLRTLADAGWRLLLPDGDYPAFHDHVRQNRYQGFHGQDRPEAQPCTHVRRRAARFRLPQAKFVAEALDPVWTPPWGGLLPDAGEDLLPAYRRLRAEPPPSPDTSLPRSGFYVMRQDWSPSADCIALSAGTVGPRVTSHKHADIFNFELYARGRRLLVDNWYGSVAEERQDDRIRMWRVGSAAHNVATVDDADSVQILREFLYGSVALPTVDDWRSAPEFAYFSGVHEGYLRPPTEISAVRRKVFYLRGGYWILLDRFTPWNEREHTYRLHFHINAPAELRPGGRLVTSGAGGNLLIVPVPGADGDAALAPNPYPIAGYENPQHLTYTRRGGTCDVFATLLVPFLDGAVPEVTAALLEVECDGRRLSPWEATALEITVNGRRDVYLDQHLQWNLPWRAGGCAGEGRLFHSACPSLAAKV